MSQSRCNRRADKRQQIAQQAYKAMCDADKRLQGKGFTVPGAKKYW